MKKTMLPKSTHPKVDYVKQRLEQMNKDIGLNNIQLDANPTLVISKAMDIYIRHLHKTYPSKEWLGICKVVQDPDTKFFHLVDMIHPEQTAHGTECEATDEGMEKLTEWIQENDPDSLDQWPLTLHSHHGMWVFWSSVDDTARLKQNDGRPYSMAVVTAYDKTDPTKIQYKGCINFFKPYNVEFDFNIIVWDDDEIDNAQQEYQAQKDFAYERAKEDVALAYDEEQDFSLIVGMLGDNVLEALKWNYNQIKNKMFKGDIDERYIELLTNIERPQILTDLEDWIEDRATMLENSFIKLKTKYYQSPLYPNFSQPVYQYPKVTDDSADFVYYTQERFPHSSMIEEDLGVKLPNPAFASKGIWYLFYKGKKITVDDYTDILFNL